MAEPAPSAPRPRAAWWRRLGLLGGRTLAALAVLVLAVAAADRSRLLADWSADRRFSVDPVLAGIVERQDAPVRLVGIWSGEWPDIEIACQRIAGLSPACSWARIDPALHKPQLSAFEERHGPAAPPALWIERGDRAMRIAAGPGLRTVLQREVGGALAALAESSPRPAVVMQGHGELAPGGGGDDGADRLLRTLVLAGWQVSLAQPGATAGLPPDALIVLPGPRAPVGDGLIAALDAHLRDGGGVLCLADDRIPEDLAAWLGRRGAIIGAAQAPRGIVRSLGHHAVGRESGFPHHNLILDAAGIADHPALAAVAGRGLVLLSPWTAAVRLIDPAALAAGADEIAPLLATRPGDAWEQPRGAALAYPDDLPADRRLPLAVALGYPAAADSARAGMGGRLAVWASRQAASDGVLEQVQFANAEAIAGLAAWAGRRAPPVEIPPAETAAFQIRGGDGLVGVLLAIVGIVLPCACLGVAMLMWWDRR